MRLDKTVSQVGRLRVGLLVILLAIAANSAFAHKARPAVASMVLQSDNSLAINLMLNVEAVIAGVGPDHNPGEFAIAGKYAKLRKLSPADLTVACASYSSKLMRAIELQFNADFVRPDFIRCNVPTDNDTSKARISSIDMRVVLPEGAKTMSWRWDRRFGIAAIRLNTGEAKEQTAYLQPGERSDKLRLISHEENAS